MELLWPIHPDDIEKVSESEIKARETGRYDVVHRIVRPDGDVRYVQEFAQSVTGEDGQLITLKGTVQDVTERIEREEKEKKEILKKFDDKEKLSK